MGGGTEGRSTRDAACQTDRDPGSPMKRKKLPESEAEEELSWKRLKPAAVATRKKRQQEVGSAVAKTKDYPSAVAKAKDYPARSSEVPSSSCSPRVHAQPYPLGARPAGLVRSRSLETLSCAPVPTSIPPVRRLGHVWDARSLPGWTRSAPYLPRSGGLPREAAPGAPFPNKALVSVPVAMESGSGSGSSIKIKPTWLWEAGGRLVKELPSRAMAAQLTSRGNTRGNTEEERWIDSSTSLHAPPLPSTSNRPLPLSCPPFPKGGGQKEITEWNKARWRIYELGANDPVTYPDILRETKDSDTASAVTSLRDKEAVHKVAQSIVNISSIGDDGAPIQQFAGIIIGSFESNERARILTSSAIVCDCDGKLFDRKVLVRLPNKTVKDGELLFFDHYYNLALLEIVVDMPLRGPSFVSGPEYGDKVFVLARDEISLLIAREANVLWHNESYLERNYYFYLSCEPPKGVSGGLVIDQDGDVTGMAFDIGSPHTAVLPSCIIRKWIEMERKFSCIARPVHGLSLRRVEFLDIQKKDEIFCLHGIDHGYLVDEVAINSTAETFGIRHGDVIVSFGAVHSQTLPQLENYLLSLGWKFLERGIPSSKVIFELQIYDSLLCCMNTISLPIGFSITPAPKKVEVQSFVGIKKISRKHGADQERCAVP